MAGFQNTQIIGNLTKDPELSYSKSGVAICHFDVAVNRSWTDRDTNEKREEVTYFRVSTYRSLAENCQNYLHKGSPVMVTGRIGASAYIGKDEQAHASLELNAQEVIFLGSKRDGNDQPEQSDAPF